MRAAFSRGVNPADLLREWGRSASIQNNSGLPQGPAHLDLAGYPQQQLDPPSNREGHAMDERAIDRTQGWISDTQARGLYSTLLFVVIALGVDVPA